MYIYFLALEVIIITRMRISKIILIRPLKKNSFVLIALFKGLFNNKSILEKQQWHCLSRARKIIWFILISKVLVRKWTY